MARCSSVLVLAWAPSLLAVAALIALAEPSAAHAQGTWSQRLVGPRARGRLRDPDPELRARAARVVGRSGEMHRSVAALLEALEVEEDLRVRVAIYDALAQRGEEAAVPRLAQRMPELGREDRAAALRAVAAIGGETAIRVLVEWVGAPDVGDDAVEGLTWVGAPAVPHLLRALRVPAAAERAARALGAVGDARATAALVTVMEGAPPSLRIALLQALGRLGDERASVVVLAALDDPVDLVVEAALVAAGSVLGPAHAPLVEARIAGRLAFGLEALVALDPALAAPHILSALREPSTPAVRAAAVRALIARPHGALVPALEALGMDPAHRGAAAEALARAPGGAGLPALLAMSETGPGADVALALALRRHRHVTPGALVERAERRLHGDPSLRGAVLSALAGSPASLDRLELALASSDAHERAQAALGITLLGGSARSAAARVSERLRVEGDPQAFRAMALAASTLGLALDPSIEGPVWDPETAPEAMWLVASGLERAPIRTRARVGRAMRRALRSTEPRVRAGAALALARAGDREAWRALAAALGDEHDAVRLAAARALASLGVPESVALLEAHQRVEREPGVRRAMRSRLDGPRGRPPPALIGGEVLYVRVVTAPGAIEDTAPSPEVDVLLPDGRWLRPLVLPGGDVLVPDLPAGDAEVQLRL